MPPGDRQGKRFLNPWRPWRQKRNWERDREHSRVAIYNGVGFVKAQISGASWYEVFTFEESFLPFLSKARFLQSIGRNETALRGIRRVVADVVADMKKRGEAVPEAVASKRYSGKFLVRVPPDIHRQLAREAAEAGVSLNRLASAKLTQ